MALTTLKVPIELRDSISSHARERGLTIASYLIELDTEYAHRRRMAAVGKAMRADPMDEDDWSEFAEFESMSEGLA